MSNTLPRFDEFIDENVLKDFPKFEKSQMNEITNQLLIEYKEVALNTMIQTMGLNHFMPEYKTGGNVTTVQNAEKGIFADNQIAERYNKEFNRKNYEQNVYGKDKQDNKILLVAGLPTLRKETFKYQSGQSNTTQNTLKLKNDDRSKTEPSKIRVSLTEKAEKQINDFKTKSINSNGDLVNGYNKDRKIDKTKTGADIDHIVSAKSVHDDKLLRLTMTDKQRAILALSDENLTFTESGANRSKGAKNLLEWSNTPNKKDKTKTNVEYFNLDEKDVKDLANKSSDFIKKEKRKVVAKYYSKEALSTGVKQGQQQAIRQLGTFVVNELIQEFFTKMKEYFVSYKSYNTPKKRIIEFKNTCMEIKSNMLAKSKNMLQIFNEGFWNGFFGNLFTILINKFITTSKNITRIINESFNGLKAGVKELTKPNEYGNQNKKYNVAAGLIAGAVISAIGGIFTESLITYLRTTPFAIVANPMGSVIGGIMTGLVSVTAVYFIENFIEVVENLKQEFKDLYKITMLSIKEIDEAFNRILNSMDTKFEIILKKIYREYNLLCRITSEAFNMDIGPETRFKNTVKYSKTLNVKDKKILKTEEDIDAFFLA